MSPTQTELPSPGASASTSTGSVAQCAVPTVRPEASTANTRPSSPESLVVTSRSPTTASPLDSTISGSRKVSSTVVSPAGADAARLSGSRTASAARPGSASRTRAPRQTQQHGQSRRDAPRRHELVVLLAHSPAGDRAGGAGGPQHRVARRVPALDELHHVDPVALLAEQRRPQRV